MERRTARRSEVPGYPTADEVLAQRREFMAMFGKLVVGAAVMTSCGPPIRLAGKVMPPAEIPPPDPGTPPSVGCGDDCPPLPGDPPPPDPPVPGGIRPPDTPLAGKIAEPEPPPDHPPLSGDEVAPEEAR